MANEHKRVVAVAVDGSDTADKAFRWTLDNIYKDGDYVIAVHCPEYKNVNLGTPGLSDPIAISNEMKKEEGKIHDLICKYAEILKKRSIHGKAVKTERGKPGELILGVCNQEQASIIVTGTRGLGIIRRTIMGSVSDYVVHHAEVPVIVYRDGS